MPVGTPSTPMGAMNSGISHDSRPNIVMAPPATIASQLMRICGFVGEHQDAGMTVVVCDGNASPPAARVCMLKKVRMVHVIFGLPPVRIGHDDETDHHVVTRYSMWSLACDERFQATATIINIRNASPCWKSAITQSAIPKISNAAHQHNRKQTIPKRLQSAMHIAICMGSAHHGSPLASGMHGPTRKPPLIGGAT